MENKKFLVSDNGTQLSIKEEIIDYLKEASSLLKQIRQTPQFARDFQEGNLDHYYEVETALKLANENGGKMTTDQVNEWIEKNNIR